MIKSAMITECWTPQNSQGYFLSLSLSLSLSLCIYLISQHEYAVYYFRHTVKHPQACPHNALHFASTTVVHVHL